MKRGDRHKRILAFRLQHWLHPWGQLVVGRILLTFGAILMVAAFTSRVWWAAVGTVLVAAGLGLMVLGLGRAHRGESATR